MPRPAGELRTLRDSSDVGRGNALSETPNTGSKSEPISERHIVTLLQYHVRASEALRIDAASNARVALSETGRICPDCQEFRAWVLSRSAE